MLGFPKPAMLRGSDGSISDTHISFSIKRTLIALSRSCDSWTAASEMCTYHSVEARIPRIR